MLNAVIDFAMEKATFVDDYFTVFWVGGEFQLSTMKITFSDGTDVDANDFTFLMNDDTKPEGLSVLAMAVLKVEDPEMPSGLYSISYATYENLADGSSLDPVL